MATIELYGIKAEVPEGYPGFQGTKFLCCIALDSSDIYAWKYVPIDALFRDRGRAYWQRRVVEAAFKHFMDEGRRMAKGEEFGIAEMWAQAENWRRIGEAAEKAAKGAGE